MAPQSGNASVASSHAEATGDTRKSVLRWEPARDKGLNSVLDVDILSAFDELPLDLPVSRYLTEVLFGVRGGQYDLHVKALGDRGEETPIVDKVEGLAKILNAPSSALCQVCIELFWIVVGVVFGRVQLHALSDFRDKLAQSWYLLTLEIRSEIPDDREVRDWVFASLPFVLAQAVFRLLCDAFIEDRLLFIGQADGLLDKISLVAHFEVTGFQVTLDTMRQSRRRLFLNRIVMNPHIDQYEFIDRKKKQEKILSKQTDVKDKPLSFGRKDGVALDDTQLDHVMQGRKEEMFHHRSKRTLGASMRRARAMLTAAPTNTTTDGLDAPETPSVPRGRGWSPPEDLTVDKYAELSTTCEALWDKHYNDLWPPKPKPKSPSPKQASENGSLKPSLASGSSPLAAPYRVSGDSSPSPFSLPQSPYSSSSARFGDRQASIFSMTAPEIRRSVIKIAGNQVTWPLKKRYQSEEEPNNDHEQGIPKTPKTPQGSELKRSGSLAIHFDDEEEPPELELELPKNPKSRFPKGKVRTVGKLATICQMTKEERKEEEEKQKRRRQETVQRKILVDPLPQELCEHEIVTTWVSPVSKRLLPHAEDRMVLRKRAAEARRLKMQVRPGTFSMPSLLKSSKDEAAAGTTSRPATGTGSRAGSAPKPGSRGGADEGAGASIAATSCGASSAPGRSILRSQMMAGTSRGFKSTIGNADVDGFGGGVGFATAGAGKSTIFQMRTGVSAGAAQWSTGACSDGRLGLPQIGTFNPVPFVLEGPVSLSSDVVVERLEKQGSAFRQGTFAEYVKENDIFTGDPKIRLDGKSLENEETAALSKAEELVGGEPKRQLRPWSMQKRV